MPPPSMPAIAAEVGARLDGGRVSGTGWSRQIQGAWRGRAVQIKCWHGRTSTTTFGWRVEVEAGGPPLTLRACQKLPGEQALIRRGVLPAVPTGDPDFDAHWTLLGAPARIATQLVDPSLREALAALAKQIDPLLAVRLSRDGVDQPLVVEGGRVTSGSQGECDAEEILAGVELAVRAAERLDALVRERAAAPPTPAELAAEENEVAVTRETFLAWLKPRMSPLVWAVAGALVVASWVTTNVGGFERAGVVVDVLDFTAIAVPFVLWRVSRRRRLGR